MQWRLITQNNIIAVVPVYSKQNHSSGALLLKTMSLQWRLITQSNITAVVPDYSKQYHCSGA